MCNKHFKYSTGLIACLLPISFSCAKDEKGPEFLSNYVYRMTLTHEDVSEI